VDVVLGVRHPYWVSGDVDGPDALVVRTPQEHRAAGIDVRMGSEVIDLDLDGRTVGVRNGSGQVTRERWDELLLATGAKPLAPSVPGADATGVYGLQTLDDGAAVLAELCGTGAGSGAGSGARVPLWSSAAATSASRWPRRACSGASR
jgi:NADPH-dependent 2,4-dienoyl-CoA reductase/sulfur reductase-like enzyme